MSSTSPEGASIKQGQVTHIGLLRVRENLPAGTIEHVFGEIKALQSKTSGILSCSWGPYSSPEGFGRGYTHGFCMVFVDEAARDAYLPHPEHQRVKNLVLSIIDSDGILAFDFTS